MIARLRVARLGHRKRGLRRPFRKRYAIVIRGMGMVEPQTELGRRELIAGLRAAGLADRRCIVHASLRGFGQVAGGAATVAEALCAVARTVVVPTFTHAPAAIPPPEDRPERNGCDYERDRLGDAHPTPFTPDQPVARDIGAIAEALRGMPGARRSDHPLSSFAAVGADAARYVTDYAWDAPMTPIARLAEDGGDVVHLATDYTSCTTVHYGEQLAGRKPFIRWALVASGGVQRVRVGGCSQGFNALAPWIKGIVETHIGRARVRRVPMAAIITATRAVLADDPRALVCDPACARCRDAVLGGPEGMNAEC
jgi:aminoglycoside 3-N-acetyltransferase